MASQIIDKISTLKFTNSEKTLIRFLLANPDIITSIKLTELAKMSYVSAPTVSRFVNKMGYDNYNDFRVAFIKETTLGETLNENIDYNLPIKPNMSTNDIEKTIANMMHLIIEETININPPKLVEKAIDMINKSNSIAVYGSFTYLPYANSFKYNMERIGKKVEILNNEGQYLFAAARTTSDILSIIISHSGSTISRSLTNNVIPIIKKEKLPALLITSSENNNNYDGIFQCQLNMSGKQQGEIYFSPLSGELSLFVIFYILYSCCYENNYAANLDNIKKALLRAKTI